MPPKRKKSAGKKTPAKGKAKAKAEPDVEPEEVESDGVGTKRKIEEVDGETGESSPKVAKLDKPEDDEVIADEPEEPHQVRAPAERTEEEDKQQVHDEAENEHPKSPENQHHVAEQPEPEPEPEPAAEEQPAHEQNGDSVAPVHQEHSDDHPEATHISEPEVQNYQSHADNHEQNATTNVLSSLNHQPDEPSQFDPQAGDSTISLTIEYKDVGKIIGRGGEVVRAIQATSGARVMIDQTLPAGEPRKVHITGAQEAVDKALKLVEEALATPVAGTTTSWGTTTVIYNLNPALVGKVIGRGGENIRALQAASSTRMQIEPPGKVIISGSERACEDARTMLQHISDGGEINQIVPRLAQPPVTPVGVGRGYPPYAVPHARAPPYFPPQQHIPYTPPHPAHAGAYAAYPYYAPQPHTAPMAVQPSHFSPAANRFPQPLPVATSAGVPNTFAAQVPPTQQPPAVAPAPTPQPSPWRAVQDGQGRTYYWNQQTNATQWEKPVDM